jgi:hypothetical protein
VTVPSRVSAAYFFDTHVSRNTAFSRRNFSTEWCRFRSILAV